MAGAPVERVPVHTIILPVLGMAAWLLVGKVGLEPLALVLVAVMWYLRLRDRAPGGV